MFGTRCVCSILPMEFHRLTIQMLYAKRKTATFSIFSRHIYHFIWEDETNTASVLDVLNSLFCQANKSRILRPPVDFSAACANSYHYVEKEFTKFMCTHLTQGEIVNKSRLYFNHPGACTVLTGFYFTVCTVKTVSAMDECFVDSVLW